VHHPGSSNGTLPVYATLETRPRLRAWKFAIFEKP
jgi:hypothetical protein